MKALEMIARAVCAGEGFEPDASVMQYTPMAMGALGHPVVHGDLILQWQVYEPVVKAVITVLLGSCPEASGFHVYAQEVLRNAVEAPEPDPEDIIDRNWRVFYGLKR